MTRTPHFSSALFSYLRQLKRNNNREWFQGEKDRYLEVVRNPLLRFIADFGPQLERISPHFVADPRPTGGSMFRIFRDTRFSRDKSPYKTHAAAQFRHEAGRDVHAPGFYLHLAPGQVFAGAGVWHPDSRSLAGIRQLIVDDSAGWKKVTTGKRFRERCTMGGDSLKRPPRGFDPEHPHIEDLRRKDFFVGVEFTEDQACSPDFITQFVRVCRLTAPYMKFLARGVGVAF